MRSIKQVRTAERTENEWGQDSTPKLSLDKVRVRNLVRVKSSIRAGVQRGCCGTSCHCAVAE
jgi:hypothetical protein